jgi:sugar lactone lactonase YvrE
MRYKWAIIFTCILCILIPSTSVYAANTFESNYTYDFWGDAKRSLPAFELLTTLDAEDTGKIKIGSIDDVFVSKDRIFLVDSTESRIDIFGTDLKILTSIKLVRNESGKIVVDEATGKQLMLNKPEGVFYSEADQELYIADTGSERIIVVDGQSYAFKRTIVKPPNMVGSTQFKPSKIIVDKDGLISVVVQGSYEGIIEINRDGSFARFFGLNKPKVNVTDFFWKSLATNQQKQKMKKTFAPSFNNLTFDSEGLIFASTFDPSAQNMVFRFNSKGENVLMQNGYYPVIGDLHSRGLTANKSQFVDVAVSDSGVYALLDKNKGRIFLYNFEGDLMNIFNSAGNLKGNVKDPTAIAWFGDQLIVTDKQFGSANIYQPTVFGQAALDAEKQYFNGKWEAAGEDFEKTLKLNANYDIAYTGVGRKYLMQDQFKDAMYYFNLGNSRGYYSKAFSEYRNLIIQHHFVWFVIPFLLLAAFLFYSEYRYNRKQAN